MRRCSVFVAAFWILLSRDAGGQTRRITVYNQIVGGRRFSIVATTRGCVAVSGSDPIAPLEIGQQPGQFRDWLVGVDSIAAIRTQRVNGEETVFDWRIVSSGSDYVYYTRTVSTARSAEHFLGFRHDYGIQFGSWFTDDEFSSFRQSLRRAMRMADSLADTVVTRTCY